MRILASLSRKAVPVIVMGMAFFLILACRPRIPAPGAPEKREIGAEKYLLAENYRKSGQLDEALRVYGEYLELNPRGAKAPYALHGIGEIYSQRGEYEKALGVFEKIVREFREYRNLSAAHLQVILLAYRLGYYDRSRVEGLKWLGANPEDPATGEVLDLLGRSEMALGQKDQAFRWWLEAEGLYRGKPSKQSELHDRLEGLIRSAGPEELEKMVSYATGSEYTAPIYYTMALSSYREDELDRAREAAMELIRSTSDQEWVTRGRLLLERITEELEVKRETIGCLLPMSGPFAIYGQEVFNGMQMAIAETSDAGQASELELAIKDTAGDPQQTVVELEDLAKKEKVMAVVGPLASKTASVAAERAQALGIPLITLTQKQGIPFEGDMIFRNFTTPSGEVERVLDVAVNRLDIRRMAILYPENPYGRYLMNLAWDKFEEMGGVITAVEGYRPEETDFAVQIKKMTGTFYPRPTSVRERLMQARTPEEEESELLSEGPLPVVDFEAVFIPDTFDKVALIAPQLVYYDVTDVVLLGTSLWESPKLVQMAADYVQGAIFPSTFFAGDRRPVVRAFTQTYEETFGGEPGLLAATGYDTINLIKRVMGAQEVRSRMGFRRALLRFPGFDGVTGKISFSPEGEVRNSPALLTVSGNKLTLLRAGNLPALVLPHCEGPSPELTKRGALDSSKIRKSVYPSP